MSEEDDSDEQETIRAPMPQDLIPTVVPQYGRAPEVQSEDDASDEAPTEPPAAVTEPVLSQERPVAGAEAPPPAQKASSED